MPLTHRKTCIVYCRVSTIKSAQEGESLDVQEHILRGLVGARGMEVLPNGKVFSDAFSGRKEDRPGLNDALNYIRTNPGKVNYFVFRGIDRFTRGGSFAYGDLKRKLESYGVEMIDSQGIIQPKRNTLEQYGFEYEWSKTSPSAITEIVLANMANTEVTNILTRMIGQEIELTQQGYKVRYSADGYVNKRIYVDNKKRTIEVPDPQRAAYYKQIFALRASGSLSDIEIVERLNAQGFRTRVRNRWDKLHQRIVGKVGGLPLSVKLLQEAICRPIYCGVLCEKWTHWKPIRAQYEGLVDIETFNKANRGKVFIKESASGLEILYDYHPEKIIKQKRRNNPLFPYKNVVMCPYCNKPFTGSCPKGKSGLGFPTYHCARNHQYFGVAKSEFDGAVENFIRRIQIVPDYIEALVAFLEHQFQQQEKTVSRASLDTDRTIKDLRSEQSAKSEAFVRATSLLLRTRLEAEIEELEERINKTGVERQKMGISIEDLAHFKIKARFFLEHLEELLLRPQECTERSLFGLLFDVLPNFEEIVFGTPKLSWIFNGFSGPLTTKSFAVRSEGLDWNTIEDTIKRWNEAIVQPDSIEHAQGG